MNVDQCMTRNPQACRAYESLERAAQLMWEGDCGCVPVIDDESRVIGMITDRDICMAAYTRGAPLHALSVESTMSRDVITCRPGDALEQALNSMRSRQVRRLPVLDAGGALLGVISLTDVARHASAENRAKSGRLTADEVVATVSGIGRPRGLDDDGFAGNDGRSTVPAGAAQVLRPKPRSLSSNSKSGHRSR